MKPPNKASCASVLFFLALHARSAIADEDDAAAVPCEAEESAFKLTPVWLSYVVIVALVGLSGLFSGLTLGLLSLDMNGLKIVVGSGDEKQAELARRIMPIRANGNLLLCTLLLGNVAVNALLSILMADLTGGMTGFLVSTFAIVIFGEIVPQSSCSRYPLEIGSLCVPVVQVFMVLLYVFTKPLSMVLNWALGKEVGTIYNSRELLAMLSIHEAENVVSHDQAAAMAGAIKYQEMRVADVMTEASEVFMLPWNATLSFKLLREIFYSGFSRIPVHGPSGRDEIIGLIFVKDLIFVDPEDETPVKRFAEILGRTFEVVDDDAQLGEVLNLFKLGRGHLAMVRGVVEHDDGRDNTYTVKGIITLEDIVEAILGDEIVDETDRYVHMEAKDRVSRAEFDYGRLDLLDSKLNQDVVGPDEASAIAAHLHANYPIFREKPDGTALTLDAIKDFMQGQTAITLRRQGNGTASAAGPPPADVLYRRGRPALQLTLVLSGKVSVAAGKDGFRSEAGPWSVLATDALALEEGTYLPDFTAYMATETVRCIQISRLAFVSALLRDPKRNHSLDHGTNSGVSGNLAVGFSGGGVEAKDRANAKVAAAKERLFGGDDNNNPLYNRTRSYSGQARGGGGGGMAANKTYTPTLGPVTLSLGGNGIDDSGAVATANTTAASGGASDGSLLPHLALNVGGSNSPLSATSSSGEFDPMGLFDEGTPTTDMKQKHEWFKEPRLPSAVLSSLAPDLSLEPLVPEPKVPLLSQSSLGEKSPLRPPDKNGATPNKRSDSINNSNGAAAAKGTSPRPASAFEIA